ncbi:hypothetical protein DFH09DRAFT_1317833 [Mycena vulgaris]|nr:hypothetical protein DFH09DRAFT_1317833 [Mycena vulgaris]
MQIWDRCAPGLKHLELRCFQTSTEAFHPTSHRWPAPIHLDLLRIIHPIRGMRDWMDHPLCPFDFSGLRVLSISTYTEVLRWPQITPALRAVKALDFIIPLSDPMIDLSPFLGLVFLRISINWDYDWPTVLNTLSTIAPSNPIRKIVICGVSADEIDAEELDSRLSSLSMHHLEAFHLEMNPFDYANLARSLHRLSSTNMSSNRTLTSSPALCPIPAFPLRGCRQGVVRHFD